jgi:hypothetical protein
MQMALIYRFTISVDNPVYKRVLEREIAYTERLANCLPEKWALCFVKSTHNILWLDR